MDKEIKNTTTCDTCQPCYPNVKIDKIEEGMTGKEVADLLYNNFDKLNKSKANKCVERKVRHLLRGENGIYNETAKNKFIQQVFYTWSKKDYNSTIDYVLNNAPSIEVGTTTTLPAGSQATVTATKDGRDAVLNFGIPKGDKGDKGIKGDSGVQLGDIVLSQELGDDENAVVSQKVITQTFEEYEKYVKILSVAEFTLKNRYFKKGNVGESFSNNYSPAVPGSNTWNCHVFYIPRGSYFKITNINSAEDTNGLTITDLDGIVTYVLNSEDIIDYENTLNYDAVLFISARITSDIKVMLSVDTEQYVSNSDLLFENYFYPTTNWKEGDLVRLQPNAISAGDWRAGFYEIKKGEVAEFINIYAGEAARNFALLDAFGKVLHVEELNIYSRYKAEEDGYLVFSASGTENNNYEISRNFAIKNSSFLKERLGYSWDSIQNQIKEYKYENFSLPYTYYTDDFNTGDDFKLFPSGVDSLHESAWNSTVLRLYAGERILFNRIRIGESSNKIYVVDPYSFKVIDVITKVSMPDYPLYYTGDYTAEQECLITFSTTYGSIFAKDIRVEKIESETAELEYSIPINVRNYYLSTSGKEVAIDNIGWFVSDFIVICDWQEKLKFSTSIVETAGNEDLVYHICYYDEKLNFISGLYLKKQYSYIVGNKVEIDIPENAKYYRLSLDNKDYVKIIQNLPVTKALSIISKNCFINGYFIDSNGRQQNNEDWKASPFIKLIKGANYFLQSKLIGGTALPNVIAYYSSANDDSFISGITKDYNVYNYRDVLTIPEGANYIRFCSISESDAYYILYSDVVYDFNDYTTESSNKVDIVVPKYIDVPIGRQTDIFLDGIIAEPDDCKRYPLKINGSTGVNDILQIGDNQLRYTPSEEKELTVYFTKYNDLRLSDINNQDTLIFRSVPKNVKSGGEVNICIAGDSLIDGTGAPCEAFRLLNEDADFTINQIGTRNATMSSIQYKHEGRGSWSWETYVNPIYETQDYPSGQGKTNAFMKNGVLDFQAYMNDNFPSLSRKEIDYFIMALGTNDVTQGSSYPSDTRINTIIDAAKTFINALLSSDKGFPNCKIAIGLPGVGAPSFVGLQSYSSVFKMAIQKLNRAYIDTFDNGKYHPNVTCVMHGAYIDRYDGYQHEDVPVNDYTTRTVRRWTNQVHPLSVGYQQWGRGYYGKLRAFLCGKL